MNATPTTTTELPAADVMSIDPITVSVDATIEEAEELLRYNRISGLPVVDLNAQLVGVISLTDLLYLAAPERPGAHPPSLERHPRRRGDEHASSDDR